MNTNDSKNAELLCEIPFYGNLESAGLADCNSIRDRSVHAGLEDCDSIGDRSGQCKQKGFVNEECVSRDSGFDFESDESLSKLDCNSDCIMFEPHPQSYLKNLGTTPVEYEGGSLVKWRIKNLKKADQIDGTSQNELLRHSLHWEEFFGNVFRYIFVVFAHNGM